MNKFGKWIRNAAFIGGPVAAIGIGVFVYEHHQGTAAKTGHTPQATRSTQATPSHQTGQTSQGTQTATVSNQTAPANEPAAGQNSASSSVPSATQSASATAPSSAPSAPQSTTSSSPAQASATKPKPVVSVPANAATKQQVLSVLQQVLPNSGSIASTSNSSSGYVTLDELDQAYWNYIGIPADHAAYQPGGGNVRQWGNIVGVNNGLSGTYVTKDELPVLQSNLQTIQQGYAVLGNGNYRLARPVIDSLKYIQSTPPAAPPAVMSAAMTQVYLFTNNIRVQVGNGKVTLSIPGHPIGDHYQAVVHTTGTGSDLTSLTTNFEVSNDGGSTWKPAVMYNSEFANIGSQYTGGVTSPPPYVKVQLVNQNPNIPMEIMFQGPNGMSNQYPLQLEGLGIQFNGNQVTVGSLTVPFK